MNTTQTTSKPARMIVIKLDKNGKRRATYLSHRQLRMFPMPIAEADLMLATGAGVLCDRHPLTGEIIAR